MLSREADFLPINPSLIVNTAKLNFVEFGFKSCAPDCMSKDASGLPAGGFTLAATKKLTRIH
jgi:hypothetical protein